MVKCAAFPSLLNSQLSAGTQKRRLKLKGQDVLNLDSDDANVVFLPTVHFDLCSFCPSTVTPSFVIINVLIFGFI